MSQQFVKGYTNNHLTWVMVDATDFATPESALSAATKIKIYGKVKGATGVNFVSSGTGSLTNDIQHVGASALGIYTIALANADLSDASAAWYDQYVIALSATGAAYQVLIVDGGIMQSHLSAVLSDVRSDVSDMHSDLLVMSGILSDAYSGIVALSDAVSNVHSELTSQFAVVSNYLSNASNFQSDILSTLGSQFAVQSNYLSYISNVVSGLGAGASASAIADKVWSDYGSKVGATPSQAYSVALRGASFASDAASGVTVLQSRITETAATSSDLVSKIWSDFTSKMGATPSQLYSVALIGASAASDAASAAAQANSRVLLVQSRLSDFTSAVYPSDISDIRSMLTYISGVVSGLGAGASASAIADKVWSDFGSKVGATPSQLYSVALIGASAASDAASAAQQANSRILLVQSRLSDFVSAVYPSDISDIRSMLTAISGLVSDAHSAAILAASNASDAYSAALLTQSMVSDVDSALTSQYSDLASKIGAVSVTIGASDLSDLSSQVVAAIGSAVLDVNVVQVKGQTVDGTGTEADPWGPV